jgi:cytosolic carboxypeptidase protein 2/3
MTMPDVNTRAGYSGGHTQWYYFGVTNMRKSIAYTFNIINLLKDDSLYNRGMRPAMFSTYDHEQCGVGWQRVGSTDSQKSVCRGFLD